MIKGPTLGDEVALFADEAQEWADLTLPTALEYWPDAELLREDEEGCE